MFSRWLLISASAAVLVSTTAAQEAQPRLGQPGKDVVWVPTPPALVEKMLDLANVTADDYVIDLGSGDGRNVIAAAKRGARALGVEFNHDLVLLSRRLAAEAGVADKARFVEADMYTADISDATVLALFLLPRNLEILRPKFLDLRPGTRIVLNTFAIPEWDPDETVRVNAECDAWCDALLYFVPARVAGTWKLGHAELTLTQRMQRVTGTLTRRGVTTPLANGRLRGEAIGFDAGAEIYAGRVRGDKMTGSVTSSGLIREWTATRVRAPAIY